MIENDPAHKITDRPLRKVRILDASESFRANPLARHCETSHGLVSWLKPMPQRICWNLRDSRAFWPAPPFFSEFSQTSCPMVRYIQKVCSSCAETLWGEYLNLLELHLPDKIKYVSMTDIMPELYNTDVILSLYLVKKVLVAA